MISRSIGNALIQYGQGYLKASGFREALFVVDPENTRMQRFLDAFGVTHEDPGLIFTMGVE